MKAQIMMAKNGINVGVERSSKLSFIIATKSTIKAIIISAWNPVDTVM